MFYYAYSIMNSTILYVFLCKGSSAGIIPSEWRKRKRKWKRKESDAWWHQVTQKDHSRKERGLRERKTGVKQKESIAKAALNIVSSPEGCDIFLQSLLAVLISLHMSWMKIEFVWKRVRYYWLYHWPIVCVYVCAVACECLCACLHVSVCARVCKNCPHQSQPIHNSNALCFPHTSLSMQLTSPAAAYLMATT